MLESRNRVAKQQTINPAHDCQRSLTDLLKPHVSRLVLCDLRKERSDEGWQQNDRVDACKLPELLRTKRPFRSEAHFWDRADACLARHASRDLRRTGRKT